MNRLVIGLVVLVAVILAALFFFLRPASSPSAGGSGLENPAPADWPMFRRTYDSSGHSPLEQINKANIENLQFEWSAPIAPGRLVSAPVVQDGVMYLAQPSDIVQAINAKTGDLIWQYRRELPDDVDEVQFPVPAAARNLAISAGKVYATTSDAYVIALETQSGKLAWETQVGDYLQTTHAAGPLVVGSKVITGRVCNRGPCYLLAHEAANGTEVWRKELSAEDGAGAWMVPSYDPELGLLFWGTASATLALKPDSGETVWSFRHASSENAYERLVVASEVTPDASAVRWISPKASGGEARKVVTGVPGSSGLVYTLDAKTGEFLWARETVSQNVVGDLDKQSGQAVANPKAAMVCPGSLGGKSWTSAAYSPTTKAVYLSLYNACTDPATGAPVAAPGSGGKLGRLEAVSVATGKTLWKYEQTAPMGSVLTTAGGLVVVGDLNRRLHILDQETGKVLYNTVLAGPITGYPISYAVEGRQYIAVTGGGGTELEKLNELMPGYNALPGVNSVYVFSLPAQ